MTKRVLYKFPPSFLHFKDFNSPFKILSTKNSPDKQESLENLLRVFSIFPAE